jgi:hypothetical protein
VVNGEYSEGEDEVASNMREVIANLRQQCVDVSPKHTFYLAVCLSCGSTICYTLMLVYVPELTLIMCVSIAEPGGSTTMNLGMGPSLVLSLNFYGQSNNQSVRQDNETRLGGQLMLVVLIPGKPSDGYFND